MWTRLLAALAISAAALAVGTAADAASPTQSRVLKFSLGACTGGAKTVNLAIPGYGPNSTHYVLGSGINLTDASGAVKYIQLAILPGADGTVLIMGAGETNVRFRLLLPMPGQTDGSGNFPLLLRGACNGPGSVSGFVIVYII